MTRRWREVAVVMAALVVSACRGGSATKDLAKHLIPAVALERSPWRLHLHNGRSTRSFGVVTEAEQGAIARGSPPTTLPLGRAKVVVTRQWIGRSASVPIPLPEGIVTIISIAARFRSPADAHVFAVSISSGGRTGPPQPIAGVPGATYAIGPYGDVVPGGAPAGHVEYVVEERGDYVLVTSIEGGGSRPTPSDAAAIAALQAAVAPTG